MGHGHSHDVETLDRAVAVELRHRIALLVGLALAGAATVFGVVTLWPSGDPVGELLEEGESSIAFAAPGVTFPSGEVTYVGDACPDGVPGESGCNEIAVLLAEDEEVVVPVARDVLESGLRAGDTVQLMRIPVEAGDPVYSYHATDRDFTLFWLLALFVVLVVLIARWRGLFALLGLAFGAIVVWNFMLPALFDGAPGVGVALAGASSIMFVVLYTTHGFSMRTSTALIGTLLGILATSLIGVVAIGQARLTGVSDDTGELLAAFATDLRFQSLLGCALVIAGLGVLNDVTITQASAVWELRASAPEASRAEIFARGMRIGRDHIASTIYTIVFAYVGTALLMLMVLQVYAQPLLGLTSWEQLAQEIVLTLSTAIGLVLAVPITTGLAALVAAPVEKRPSASESSPTVGDGSPSNVSTVEE